MTLFGLNDNTVRLQEERKGIGMGERERERKGGKKGQVPACQLFVTCTQVNKRKGMEKEIVTQKESCHEQEVVFVVGVGLL